LQRLGPEAALSYRAEGDASGDGGTRRGFNTRMEKRDESRVRQALRTVFGHERLRRGQADVIERVMQGRSTLAIMPTGAGKSLCYQLPALLLDGRTVVVSPLIALMKDQCEKLRDMGVAAVQVNSQLSAAEVEAAEQAIDDGSARIVLTTPERLAEPTFLRRLQAHPVALLAVDEAHCISQWGHDFRPAFLGIGDAVVALGKPPVLALTATAGEQVAQDVMKRLGIPASGLVDTGAYRSNLHYAVEQADGDAAKRERMLALVGSTTGSGIVYTATVKAAEQVFEALQAAGTSVARYHGKLGGRERREAQDAFMDGAVRVMVATNAFGMGIDKPDIRFVLHYQMPPSLESYYQESGRAGRDGEPAQCTLLFHTRDKAVQQFFLAGRYPSADDLQAVHRQLLAAPPEGEAWTSATLLAALDRPRNKVQTALALLRQEKLLSVDRRAAITVRRPAVSEREFETLADGYRARRSEDQATLERMVFYAQTGSCRWQVLLADLEDRAPAMRCGTCDNCRRMAAHEASMAQSIVLGGDEPPKAPPTGKPFIASDIVTVKRYGRGTVVASGAGTITVEFSDGSRREFLPDYVRLARRSKAGTGASATQAAAAAA
jgi:ATP-dependent DNA helicase RecQ